MDKICKTKVLRNSTIQQFRCASCALVLDCCVGSMKHDLWCPGNNSVERNLLVVVETLTWRLAYQMRIEGFLISNHVIYWMTFWSPFSWEMLFLCSEMRSRFLYHLHMRPLTRARSLEAQSKKSGLELSNPSCSVIYENSFNSSV